MQTFQYRRRQAPSKQEGTIQSVTVAGSACARRRDIQAANIDEDLLIFTTRLAAPPFRLGIDRCMPHSMVNSKLDGMPSFTRLALPEGTSIVMVMVVPVARLLLKAPNSISTNVSPAERVTWHLGVVSSLQLVPSENTYSSIPPPEQICVVKTK